MRLTPKNHTYLALDVALANLGWAVVSNNLVLHSGVISTPPRSKKTHGYLADHNILRVRHLVTHLNLIVDEHTPCEVIAEFPTGGGISATAVSAMAMATGIVATYFTARGLKIIPVQPNESKRLVNARGKVSKGDIQEYVCQQFPTLTLPKQAWREHIADALAAYLVARNNKWIRQ